MNGKESHLLESILTKEINDLEINKHQLVSITKKIEWIDAVDFYSNAHEMSSVRTFWTSPQDGFTLAGAGSIKEFGTASNRFKATQHEWEDVQKHAKIHNPYHAPGTGLVALGGMSFDPKKATTPLWEKFSDSLFHIPAFTLSQFERQTYLSINIVVSQDDHAEQLAKRLQAKLDFLLTPRTSDDQDELRVVAEEEIDPEQWKRAVARARDTIKTQDVEKIVMARELRLKLSAEVSTPAVIRYLLASQPTSYVFAFSRGDDCFVGATPERLVQVKQEQMLSMCLAGTAPRGKTIKEDEQIKDDLLNNPKNLGEHHFVVDMIRQSIESYCSTLDIPAHPEVYQLKNLQHLFTPVQGELKEGTTIFDLIEQLHPTPALGGTPTDKALAFIRNHELLDRGWYGAPVGMIDSNGFGEFIVAIRSGLIQGDEASLFAGCGIVADSDIDEEYRETNMKFLPMLHALKQHKDNKSTPFK